MTISLMHLNIAEIIFLLFLLVFLGALFVWIPFMILKESIQALIGRPISPGWKRVKAEVRTEEAPREVQEHVFAPIPPIHVANYEIDGAEHRAMVREHRGSGNCSIYVQRNNPNNVWQPKYENRFAALIGAVLILSFWAGLVYAGIYIGRMLGIGT